MNGRRQLTKHKQSVVKLSTVHNSIFKLKRSIMLITSISAAAEAYRNTTKIKSTFSIKKYI